MCPLRVRIAGIGLEQSWVPQQRQPFLARRGEIGPIPFGHWIGGRQAELLEILVLPSFENAEVEMRPRRQPRAPHQANGPAEDRKSTRLNSSHGYISYAVFCLKKKKTNKDKETHTIVWHRHITRT